MSGKVNKRNLRKLNSSWKIMQKECFLILYKKKIYNLVKKQIKNQMLFNQIISKKIAVK
jgi:hypothetical protein